MKKTVLLLLSAFLIGDLSAQITAPAVKANFGVDADLRANYFDGFVVAGNDDWFKNNAGPGDYIIDTTGASYLMNLYNANSNNRMFPFFRGMRYPQLSVVNNRLLIDGIFIRDHHGDDSTVFASGSNKNGQDPASWITPVSQGIPDKNDILDMFMHARRDGPSLNDSLWLFGGVSLDATTGNRYFDFEMYQTDITYNRPTMKFSGTGPDAGHTAWLFDALGNVLRPGDVIFTAEYSSSSLTLLEARIWVDKSTLSITPATFSWGGLFDGANSGSSFGYANILPKTSGTFYTGMQCGNNTWAGPFGLVLQNNTVVANYTARQFMEFSVNLSKLGLDHLSLTGDPCGMPFRRILVKSRSSTSFNAELKDFVGPFDFFRAPRANASATVPVFCGTTGFSTISVSNALPTSLYTWTTPNGNIVGNTVGPTIDVNMPGSYIVTQQLMDSCGTSYARDTVMVMQDINCSVLKTNITRFRAAMSGNFAKLDWTVTNDAGTKVYEVERSYSDAKFISIGKVLANPSGSNTSLYTYTDNVYTETASTLYYRLKIIDINGNIEYSKVIVININNPRSGIKLVTGLSGSGTDLVITSENNDKVRATIFTVTGEAVQSYDATLFKGTTIVSLSGFSGKPGIYLVKVQIGEQVYVEKMAVGR